MQDIVLAHRNIVLTHGDIYLHGNQKKKFGGAIKPYNNTIKKMTSQVNNPSTGIAGLGTGTDVLSRSQYKPLGTNIMYGGSISSQLSKINFNTNKRDRNVRLRL
jgi:predicted outer membrane repeat protein